MGRFSYERFIALRYLRSGTRSGFISFISAISLAGVALGVAALIIVLAVMNGFEKDLRNKILGVRSHIVVTDRWEDHMSDYSLARKDVKNVDGVTGCAPYIVNQVVLRTRAKAIGTMIWGIDPELHGEVSELGKNMKQGTLSLLNPRGSERPGIVMGRYLASRLGLSEGEKLTVITPIFKKTPLGDMPKMANFRLVGTFETGMYEYDTSFVYIHLKSAQKLLNMKDKVSGLAVRVDDIYKAREAAKNISGLPGSKYDARDWMRLNRNLFAALKLEKVAMTIILTLIVLVAAFSIMGMLVMNVMDKKREIGILKAMGASSKSIMKIFVNQGLVIGAMGAGLGGFLGVVISECLKKYKFIELPGDIYYIDRLPAQLVAGDVVMILVGTLILSFLATIYPAWRAARVDPVEAIRYE